MSWVKIESNFYRHRKVRDLSPAAFRAWVSGLGYCSDLLTDGRIPVSAFSEIRATTKIAEELVMAGLWERNDNDIIVHDYLSYQASRAKVEGAKQSLRERVSRHRNGNVTRYEAVARNGSVTEPSNGAVTDLDTDKIQIRSDKDLLKNVCPKDLTGSYARAREETRTLEEIKSEEAQETMCPMDLETQAEALSIPDEFARFYQTDPDAIREVIREFVAYWTIGAGGGQRRARWLSKLRQKLKEHGQQNRYKAQGLVDHEKKKAALARKPRRPRPLPEPVESPEERARLAEAALAKIGGR